ncbi:MAG TPA: VWA domain-containing protein, partial [Urbifossiella sp.]|nr:VWA domain-containing protein [Urbifossiella sp.]
DRSAPGPADETLTKFDYCVCLAAALGYLMILQQDPVGLVAFDTKLATVVPPKSKRTQLGTILSVLANLKPTGDTDIAGSLTQLAPMLRGKSLVMVFSDLITDPEPVLRSLYRLRYSGHEVILFHVLDELEANFPLTGLVDFADVEGPERHLEVDAAGIRDDYLTAVRELRETYRRECAGANVDYVPIDTSVGFDKALLDYLQMRQRRFG